MLPPPALQCFCFWAIYHIRASHNACVQAVRLLWLHMQLESLGVSLDASMRRTFAGTLMT